MKTSLSLAPTPNLKVRAVERTEAAWTISVTCRVRATCPACGTLSISRHSSYLRTLRDLPAQGTPVTVQARLTRWRCLNHRCERRIFADSLPSLAAPYARRTARLAGIVQLFGHSAGGRPSERLMGPSWHAGEPHHHFTRREAKRQKPRQSSLSTPEQNCIGWPEEKCIDGAAARPLKMGLCGGLYACIGSSGDGSALLRRERRLL